MTSLRFPWPAGRSGDHHPGFPRPADNSESQSRLAFVYASWLLRQIADELAGDGEPGPGDGWRLPHVEMVLFTLGDPNTAAQLRRSLGSRPAAPRCPSGSADAQTCCGERQEHDERHLPDPDLLSDPGVSVMLALCGPRSNGENMPTKSSRCSKRARRGKRLVLARARADRAVEYICTEILRLLRAEKLVSRSDSHLREAERGPLGRRRGLRLRDLPARGQGASSS
jgi:hypothetical protein